MGKIPSPRRWGAWGSGPKKVGASKVGLKFPAPLINSIFSRRKSFLWVSGWVGGDLPGP